jgi:uncharacterized protein YigE (DUF2233 family)
MRPLLLFLLLSSCAQASPPTAQPASPCHQERFENSSFTVCDAEGGSIEIRTGHRTFASLQAALGDRAKDVAFAMNAGMFDEQGRAIGLMIENGRQVHAINRREGGGNFHLMPNGVFLVRKDATAEVMESGRYKPAPDIAFATQSGPMLLIDGKLHPKFEADGQSRYARNGVGIGSDGKPVFVVSESAVSFGKLARFLRDRHHVRDALFFDGSVSSLWDPANNRMDSFADLGPMVVVFRPSAGSKPGREAPARP